MKRPVQVESRGFALANTPILHHSKTTRNLYLVDRSCRSEAEIPLQRGYGVSERTTIKWQNSLHFEDSLSAADCRELQLVSQGRGDGCATRQPQGIGSESCLNGTSQGEPVLSEVEGTAEDARKDGHIRGRSHAVA
ncbi:MAG: hypothetical protein P8X67_22275 [Syntrophobacterales bacterium]